MKNQAAKPIRSARAAHFFIAAALSAPLIVAAQSSVALQPVPPSAPVPTGNGAISVNEWLLRMHEAANKKRSYTGTLVQSSAGVQGGMSSARIWYSCDGSNQVERIETLTGAPRSSIRHDSKLVTFMPDAKLARVETREGFMAAGNFSELLKPGAGSIPDFYTAKSIGNERIAGLEADVVQLYPRDNLRYGYRLWTERKSAMVLKLQTLDAQGAVIEQAAFSELQLDAPVRPGRLKRMMAAPEGWRVEQIEVRKATAADEGWEIKNPVPGFKAVSCYKRGSSAAASGAAASTLQWIFSDGLATVSLFIEPFDKARHNQEGLASSGATSSLLRRMNEHFLTAVGEVPPQTLKGFAAALERKR